MWVWFSRRGSIAGVVVGGLLLGSDAFMEWAKDTLLSTRKKDRQLPVLDRLRPRPALEDIVGQVAKHWQVRKQHILKRGAKRNLPRDVAIYLAREMSGCSGRELGRYFGGITGAGIGVRCKHVEKVLETDRNLRHDIKYVRAVLENS